ncbi:Mur ligase family protein [Hathewaya histolytica]|uniref:Lipid II isoglutaminyl synthase (glutamine-hydrolyzing) subunit MurT n=1 Tax=Hathewaya histolytica TaxID=1498 RepID=A0A4U9RMQ5_HATHI|nr:Mur ligase family protein [Hathewaya histolytica]VTQ93484.1 UDP-N-acetylmuramoyl-L-alanyl-D-glutamate-2, 6-diaminopimelate ligase MurE [Hathewaya histolytica]
MTKINIKSFFSIISSKTIIKLCKIFSKGGTNFPGKIALKIDKNILNTVAKGYRVILVTGTNGKTTTTNMIYNIIKSTGKKVITNSSGANLYPGIVTSFVSNFSFKNNNDEKFAVIEVDEANVKFITKHVNPEIITITNLFRDQLDRYGEVYTTLEKILDGVQNVPNSTLVLNGDESLLGSLDLKNKVIYYGFESYDSESNKVHINSDAKFCKFCKTSYKYNFVTYNHLGDYYCPNCGYKHPELKYKVEKVLDKTPNSSTVVINNEEILINQPGTYNIYNALCAYAIGSELSIDKQNINKSLENQESSFGRQEEISIDNKKIKIILVKNPAGYDEALNTLLLDKRKINLSFMLNDNYADGRDVSWIWDVDFEKLKKLNVSKIIVSGMRKYDMAVRLKICGFNEKDFIICNDFENIVESIKSNTEDFTYILATYTAMTDFRKFLNAKGYAKEIW